MNYYKTHIPNFAQTAVPIYSLLCKKKKFQWTEACEIAFTNLKNLLKNRITLHSINEDLPFQLYTDASNVASGAVLMQDEKPIEFYSKKFSPIEQRYSTYDRETFAIVDSIMHFRYRLIDRKFTVYTDHKPLIYWMQRPPPNERNARWLVKLQELDFEIKYIEGKIMYLQIFVVVPKKPNYPLLVKSIFKNRLMKMRT